MTIPKLVKPTFVPSIFKTLSILHARVNAARRKRDLWERSHAAELHQAEVEYRTEKLKLNLPTMENAGLAIWCRNAEVCSNATLCRGLQCRFKKNADDLVSGCGACGQFVVAVGGEPGGNWGSLQFMPKVVFDKDLEPIPPP